MRCGRTFGTRGHPPDGRRLACADCLQSHGNGAAATISNDLETFLSIQGWRGGRHLASEGWAQAAPDRTAAGMAGRGVGNSCLAPQMGVFEMRSTLKMPKVGDAVDEVVIAEIYAQLGPRLPKGRRFSWSRQTRRRSRFPRLLPGPLSRSRSRSATTSRPVPRRWCSRTEMPRVYPARGSDSASTEASCRRSSLPLALRGRNGTKSTCRGRL